MPMTMEQMEAKLGELTKGFDAKSKDFELKLAAQKSEADSWKTVAEQKEAESKKFKEEAEKAKTEQLRVSSEARKAEIKSFLEAKKTAGIITPAQQETLEKIMTSLTSETTIHEFSDKDGRKISHTQFSLMKEFVNSITGKKVTYGPITPGAQRTPETPDSAVDSEVHFTEVVVKDKGRVRAVVDDYGFHMKALEYQAEQKKSGITVEYGDALIAVSKAEKQAA